MLGKYSERIIINKIGGEIIKSIINIVLLFNGK